MRPVTSLNDSGRLRDGLFVAESKLEALTDRGVIRGWVKYELTGPDGRLKQYGAFPNLVTNTGDQYFGDRAAQVLGSTVAVTAIATGTTALVTTGASHGFGPNDRVTLAGITPAGYNGSWVVTTVPSATTFNIYVGTALGAGSAFGTAQGLTLGPASGMRLGTGATAAAKTGAGAAIVTFSATTNSAKAFDSGFPTSSIPGTARRIQYKTTWAAGDATANGLNEVVITNEQPISQVAGTAANTVSRALLSPVVNKGASDTLSCTWSIDLLGS